MNAPLNAGPVAGVSDSHGAQGGVAAASPASQASANPRVNASGERIRAASLAINPRLNQWLRFHGDGLVDVMPGKVEIGQGIVTALAQIAAEELDITLDQVRMIPAATNTSPDEAVTSGSLSIQESGQRCARLPRMRAHCFSTLRPRNWVYHAMSCALNVAAFTPMPRMPTRPPALVHSPQWSIST